ncbi:nuclear transport factor 2 family protein [Pseudomonas sp. QE6]|uniref:nuclear transport factor 2 family protein n=1 Tax=Pseudomonas TaxID=286 RepID=UPI002F3550E8
MSNYTADSAAINRVLTDYVEGMTFADEARLRQAFHPSCKIIGNYHGELEWASLDDFIGAIKAESPPSSGAPPVWELKSLDITGDSAVAKVTDDFLGMHFTDYLSLLRIGSQWSIINKLYYLHE